ncbi:hypothetical protein CC85DRAFT_186192 [Cutaneotrichosporon oleaginosum]|uniref:Uncharacterized protein n=1 Tax=Cutaneotrichosporon oleaginosum TaxID=879819 RepID=A0A0J0XUN3_9TREE|nr:uncharacterized protein CC85DRAFT_186192 [Cutaneotrichosporon oleaginosum]KLT44785.1 hypothetical protein CC85DRAFT_186192 [Cutaneotrichosporon oleaginosum]TXT11925.1 hypothetical protein COLE_02335 [Cutaneotrichosporon oleaginosum]
MHSDAGRDRAHADLFGSADRAGCGLCGLDADLRTLRTACECADCQSAYGIAILGALASHATAVSFFKTSYGNSRVAMWRCMIEKRAPATHHTVCGREVCLRVQATRARHPTFVRATLTGRSLAQSATPHDEGHYRKIRNQEPSHTRLDCSGSSEHVHHQGSQRRSLADRRDRQTCAPEFHRWHMNEPLQMLRAATSFICLAASGS